MNWHLIFSKPVVINQVECLNRDSAYKVLPNSIGIEIMNVLSLPAIYRKLI